MLTSESTTAEPLAVSSADRVRSYRKRQKETGQVAMTVFVPREMAQRVRELASSHDCVPAAIVQAAINYLCTHLEDGRVTIT